MPATSKRTAPSSRARRGSTLLELCIVMAILAIISTMIASFSVLFGGYVSQNESRYLFANEVTDWRQAMEDWIAEVDEAEAMFTVTERRIAVEDTAYAVEFNAEEKTLTFYSPKGTSTITAEAVDTLTFSLPDAAGTPAILKCTLGADVVRSKTPAQTFLLTLRCGAFGGGDDA